MLFLFVLRLKMWMKVIVGADVFVGVSVQGVQEEFPRIFVNNGCARAHCSLRFFFAQGLRK